MAKRIKRSHLKRFSASRVSVPREFDPNKTAVYDIWSKYATITTKDNPTIVTEEVEIGGKKYIKRRQIVRWGQDVHIQRRNKNKRVTEDLKDRINQVTYLNEVPPTKGMIAKIDITEGNTPQPKAAVVNALHDIWQTERRQGIETFGYSVVMYDLGDCALRMFFSGNKVKFLKEYTNGLKLVSLTYPSKQEGLSALRRGKLTWTIYKH